VTTDACRRWRDRSWTRVVLPFSYTRDAPKRSPVKADCAEREHPGLNPGFHREPPSPSEGRHPPANLKTKNATGLFSPVARRLNRPRHSTKSSGASTALDELARCATAWREDTTSHGRGLARGGPLRSVDASAYRRTRKRKVVMRCPTMGVAAGATQRRAIPRDGRRGGRRTSIPFLS
jgi:hypothetical protein